MAWQITFAQMDYGQSQAGLQEPKGEDKRGFCHRIETTATTKTTTKVIGCAECRQSTDTDGNFLRKKRSIHSFNLIKMIEFIK